MLTYMENRVPTRPSFDMSYVIAYWASTKVQLTMDGNTSTKILRTHHN